MEIPKQELWEVRLADWETSGMDISGKVFFVTFAQNEENFFVGNYLIFYIKIWYDKDREEIFSREVSLDGTYSI